MLTKVLRKLGWTATWIKPQLPSWGVSEVDTIPITNASPFINQQRLCESVVVREMSYTVEGGKRPRIHRFLVEFWTMYTWRVISLTVSCWLSRKVVGHLTYRYLQYMFILFLNSHWLAIIWDDSTTGFSWWWLTNRWCYDVKIYRFGHTHHPWRTGKIITRMVMAKSSLAYIHIRWYWYYNIYIILYIYIYYMSIYIYIYYVYIANRRKRKPQTPNLPRWKGRNAWRPLFFRPNARMWIVQKPRKLGGGASQPDDLMIMIHQLVCVYIHIYIYYIYVWFIVENTIKIWMMTGKYWLVDTYPSEKWWSSSVAYIYIY